MSSMSDNFGVSNAASARAIADDAELSITEDGRAAAFALGVTRPAQSPATKSAVTRGYSDLVAHIAYHHDRSVHVKHQPTQALQARLFNELERARCEALGSLRLTGSAANLAALWSSQAAHQIGSSRSETERQLLAVVTLVRSQLGLAGESISTGTGESLLLPEHRDKLKGLHQHIDQQHAFALIAKQLIAQIEFAATDLNESNTAAEPASQPEEDSTNEPEDAQPSEDTDEDSDGTLSVTLREEEDRSGGELQSIDAPAEDTPDVTANRDAPVATESDTASDGSDQHARGYHVYSRSEDEVVRATDLCNNTQLVELRDLLDQHIHRHARVIGKLSGKLQRVLMAEQARHWEFNLAEGVLDTARLTRVVTQPLAPLSFKQETDSQFKDTTITLLVDNSRSMLGKPIAIAAACADLLSQTLERCGVSVEILGFTTTELHRGALYQRWQEDGAAEPPGRLNGLRHIIYKAADQPYRRSRMNFGVMLMKDLLKQNIDGESLMWAYQRLRKRPENRKVLIVISDGAPIDTSTMATNPQNLLVDHLHQVITGIETAGQVELLAIGIGHDVTQYYSRAMKIMDVKDLSQSLLAHMSELFNHSPRSGGSRARW